MRTSRGININRSGAVLQIIFILHTRRRATLCFNTSRGNLKSKSNQTPNRRIPHGTSISNHYHRPLLSLYSVHGRLTAPLPRLRAVLLCNSGHPDPPSATLPRRRVGRLRHVVGYGSLATVVVDPRTRFSLDQNTIVWLLPPHRHR